MRREKGKTLIRCVPVWRSWPWLMVLLPCLGACAPARVLDVPVGWPVEWKGRKLYNTPNAFIFASSDAAAWEADELAARVSREFESQTSEKPIKGLLLVTDVKDQPAFESFRQYCDMKAREAGTAEGRALTDDELKKRHDSIAAALIEQGHDPESDLAMTPVSISASQFEPFLGLSLANAPAPAWSVVVPSNATIEQANNKALRGEYARREIGLLVQLPLEPITRLEHRLRNVKAFVARDVELFHNHAEAQSNWSEDRRHEATQTYMDRKLTEGLVPVIPLLGEVVRLTAGVVDIVADPLVPDKPRAGSDEAAATPGPAPTTQPGGH